MADRELEVKIHFNDDVTADYVSAELPKYGLHQAAPDEFGEQELVTAAVVVIGSVFALAHLVLSVMEKYRGGTVVDLTGDQLEVRRSRDVPLGGFVIRAKDGEVKIETKDLPPDGLERIVVKVLDIGKGIGTAAIEAAVKSAKSGGESIGAADS